MKEKNKSNNALIKRKNLVKLMNDCGINRIASGVSDELETFFEIYMEKIIERLKEEIDVRGKKVLDRVDVRRVIDDLTRENEVDMLY